MEFAELPPVSPLVLYIVLPILGIALFAARSRYPRLYGTMEIAASFVLVWLSVRVIGGFTIGKSAFGGQDGFGSIRATIGTAAFLGALFVFIRGLEKLLDGWQWRGPYRAQEPRHRDPS